MIIVLYNSSVETFLKIGVADMSIIFEDGQETVITVHLCKKNLEMGMRRLLVLYLSVVFEISSYLHVLFISFGEGNGTPLQYSCLKNPMDGGAWKAAVHGVAEGRTRLSDFTFTFHFHALEKEMATTPVFLPGESQGLGSLVGCRLWGRTKSDTTEVT